MRAVQAKRFYPAFPSTRYMNYKCDPGVRSHLRYHSNPLQWKVVLALQSTGWVSSRWKNTCCCRDVVLDCKLRLLTTLSTEGLALVLKFRNVSIHQVICSVS